MTRHTCTGRTSPGAQGVPTGELVGPRCSYQMSLCQQIQEVRPGPRVVIIGNIMIVPIRWASYPDRLRKECSGRSRVFGDALVMKGVLMRRGDRGERVGHSLPPSRQPG